MMKVAFAGVLIIAFLLYYVQPKAQQFPDACVDESTREHIKGLVNEALDQALQAHTTRLFESWMKDNYGQPSRVNSGMRQGLHAYVNARQNALQWEPKICERVN